MEPDSPTRQAWNPALERKNRKFGTCKSSPGRDDHAAAGNARLDAYATANQSSVKGKTHEKMTVERNIKVNLWEFKRL